MKHLSCKQLHNIVNKGNTTSLRNLRKLQNIHGLNKLSKPGHVDKDFVLYVLNEISSTPDVLFKCLKLTNICY